MEAVPEDQGAEILDFYTPPPPLPCEKHGGFLVANVLSDFPKKIWLKFVTPETSENFTTFFTAKKEIYHLELALGATSRNFSLGMINRYMKCYLIQKSAVNSQFLFPPPPASFHRANFRRVTLGQEGATRLSSATAFGQSLTYDHLANGQNTVSRVLFRR